MIVSWPEGISVRGEIRHTPTHFIDLYPTILELAGVEASPPTEGPALPGRSLVSVFSEEAEWSDRYLFWAHSGNRAIRQGDWKAVVLRSNSKSWELYNMDNDRAELHDLATKQPEKLNELSSVWESLRNQFGSDFEIGSHKKE